VVGKIIRTLAVSYPTPVFAPVTIMTLPERSGMWSTENLDFGGMLSLINDFATLSMFGVFVEG
jgi:hypothetical protein